MHKATDYVKDILYLYVVNMIGIEHYVIFYNILKDGYIDIKKFYKDLYSSFTEKC